MNQNQNFRKAYVFTSIPNRYGGISNVDKHEIIGKTKIFRFYVPQHKNKLYRQIISHIFFSIQAIFMSIKYRNKFDFVFATSSRLGTAILASSISKILNKKYAIDIRDIFSDSLKSISFINTFAGKRIVRFVEILEKKIIKKSSWINFVSAGFLNYQHINNENKNVKIYTNGIDQIFIENRRYFIKKKMNGISFPLIITYAGNIGYGQSLDKVVVDVAKYFGNRIKFQLIGDGNSISLIKEKVLKSRLSNVDILNPMKRTDLLNYYNNADILFFQLNDIPAFENVLPSKIFDYGSFDKPILAGVKGEARKFLLENISKPFIYYPNNSNEAINQINKIILSKKIKINNQKFVDSYNRRKIMDNMVNSIYDELK